MPSRERCAECGGRVIRDEQHGEFICCECGVVVGRLYNVEREWREFDHEQYLHRSRASGMLLLSQHDLGIGGYVYGGEVHSSIVTQHKLTRMYTSKDKNLIKAFIILRQACSRLELAESVKEEAAWLYRKAIKRNILRGRSIAEVVAACLFFSLYEMWGFQVSNRGIYGNGSSN